MSSSYQNDLIIDRLLCAVFMSLTARSMVILIGERLNTHPFSLISFA
jgi:hypothetical protein